MDKSNYTYRIFLILGGLFAFELLFWVACYFVLDLFGYFGSSIAGEKMVFITENYKYWFILLPIAYIGFTSILLRRNTAIKNIATPGLSSSFLKSVSNFKTFIRFFLLRNFIVLMIFAAMQPAFGGKTVKGKVNGIELVFAVDISVSMNTRDMDGKTSRLEVAKRAINQFINLTNGGKIGLVVFAGSAYPQLPLTSDYGAAKMYAQELSSDLISNQGTNIGLALEMCSDFFTKEKTKKIIVLISDGEDHEGGIDAAIKKLNDKKIDLSVLGLGSKSGGLIPQYANNTTAGYVKDDYGKTVVSKVDGTMLSNLAKKAKGEVVVSSDDYPNVNSLLAQINNLETTKKVDVEFEVKENKYQLFLFVALLFLIALIIVEEIGKLKHFKNVLKR